MILTSAVEPVVDSDPVIEHVSSIMFPEKVRIFWETLPDRALSLGVRILLAFLVCAIGLWISKILRRIIRKSMEKAKADKSVIAFTDSIVRVVIYILLAFLLASYFGVDAATIVALLGSLGVTIGLALQGGLSNLAGGILLMSLKPFRSGDYILAGSCGVEGTVREVRLFYTKLCTFDNKVVSLPNGALTNSTITNFSQEKFRRLDVKVTVSYRCDLDQVQKVLKETIEANEFAELKEPYGVYVDELGDNGVQIIVRAYCRNNRYWDMKFSLTEEVKKALDQNGIEIPFPQMDVHICNE